jgi:MFS family permease
MSYESIADEASFVLGPVLVGLLSALVNPAAPLVLSMLLTGTVVVAFALRADRRLPHAPAASAGKRTAARPLSLPAVLLAPGIPLLIAAMFLVGGVFGSTLTALTAFMRERGAVEQAGVVYGAMSIGAIAFALIVAVLPARFVLAARWPVFAVLGLAGCAALALGGDLVAVVPALALAGCGVGAVLVTLFSLGAAAAPHGRSTTVLTALQSTLVVGQAVVTALGGTLSERAGSGAGFAVAVGLAGGLAVLGLIALGRFRRRSRASTAQR